MATPALLDPSQVMLSLFGITLTGFAPGTFIEISYDEDETSETVGADGELAVVVSKNRLGTLKLSLMPTAAANDVFSAAAELLRTRSAGAFSSMLCKDLQGRGLANAESAWVKTRPAMKQGKETTDMIREWVFKLNPLALAIGGNY